MRYKVLLLVFTVVCASCAQRADINYRIVTGQPLQVMEHFGASDAWSMHVLGKWPEEKQKQIADWLFSTENDANGKPKGIGLSLWRFNLGAGSTEQGDASQIGSPWMRTECFLQPDGSYNWDKQEGQRNFLRLAKERGVNKFLAFLNSPPVYFTQNGLATNTGRDGTLNLKDEHYEDFARFLANVIKGVEKKDGIKFDYLSPFNEPDDWGTRTGSACSIYAGGSSFLHRLCGGTSCVSNTPLTGGRFLLNLSGGSCRAPRRGARG